MFNQKKLAFHDVILHHLRIASKPYMPWFGFHSTLVFSMTFLSKKKTRKLPSVTVDFLRYDSKLIPIWHLVLAILGGGFKDFLFSPLFGEDFQFDSYFSNGLKPPTSMICLLLILLLSSFFWCKGWVNEGAKPKFDTKNMVWAMGDSTHNPRSSLLGRMERFHPVGQLSVNKGGQSYPSHVECTGIHHLGWLKYFKIFTYNLFYHPDKMLIRKMLPNVFIANMVFYSSELSNKFSANLGSSKVGIESFSFGSAESHTTLDKMRAGLSILLMAEIPNNHWDENQKTVKNVNNGINYQLSTSTGKRRISEPSTVPCHMGWGCYVGEAESAESFWGPKTGGSPEKGRPISRGM